MDMQAELFASQRYDHEVKISNRPTRGQGNAYRTSAWDIAV